MRIATGVLLILLIALKTAVPVFVSLKTAEKENSSLTENDGEKKTENTSNIEKEKEFANVSNIDIVLLLWYTQVCHVTGYQNNYQTTHFLKVTSPPPDLYLHPIC